MANIQIADLYSAVNDALESRNEALSYVSDEEMKNVSGGWIIYGRYGYAWRAVGNYWWFRRY
ncbi:hypothetical protein IQ227_23120 [Anabaena aphanizomenioides LEGE 00250]|uniref:Uncharacterized protein n=1 Tax=Sphaerospermopsis aphanizomenoides LEGE 00250 TaxID=2777972 RepID=A0ABR9VN37_9CYAN|nr:hypothetical protein [Sphaerospermopsis aphanizomenoides]MBE9238830.1 hypothetical protein [Sphaerospermopsis aphanizomenoides LEGE 00250]